MSLIKIAEKNVGVMDLHPLPYYGFRVTYLIEHRGFSLMEASLMQIQLGGEPQGSQLGPLLFSVFTNDPPLTLNKVCVSMYEDN